MVPGGEGSLNRLLVVLLLLLGEIWAENFLVCRSCWWVLPWQACGRVLMCSGEKSVIHGTFPEQAFILDLVVVCAYCLSSGTGLPIDMLCGFAEVSSGAECVL